VFRHKTAARQEVESAMLKGTASASASEATSAVRHVTGERVVLAGEGGV